MPPLDLMRLARVNVVGTSGSGKSTIAKQLAAILNCPHIELDKLYWEANWSHAADNVFFDRIANALHTPRWVLDGNYDRSLSIKWREVTTVIWLDYSFARTFGQSLRRAVSRMITRQELWPGTGNRESFRLTFLSKESVLLWMIRTHGKMRRRYLAVMNDAKYAGIHFVRLRNPRETKTFLASIQQRDDGA